LGSICRGRKADIAVYIVLGLENWGYHPCFHALKKQSKPRPPSLDLPFPYHIEERRKPPLNFNR
jgi:hypothetical protein